MHGDFKHLVVWSTTESNPEDVVNVPCAGVRSALPARMGHHKGLDSCEQLRVTVRGDVMHHAMVIAQYVMTAPCFPCIMGSVVTAPVGISMPRGGRGIVPRRFGSGINGG